MKRREAAPVEPPLPAGLARFRQWEWYDPTADPPPESWVPYDTDEDKWSYHTIRARRRWSEAQEEWRDAQTG